MNNQTDKRAAILVIGDEILSGRTHDSNTRDLALKCGEAGITVVEARVIPDDIPTIVTTVNSLRADFDYVFVTGGIGPTHDDKTAQAMANAFGVQLQRNADAWDRLVKHYGGVEHMNEGRAKMAEIPVGAKLIDNPVSTAPGFQLENVFVFAGVPKIMNAMADGVIPNLVGGAKIHSVTLNFDRAESTVAPILAAAEKNNTGIMIGSYPRFTPQGQKLAIVLRGKDEKIVQKIADGLFIEIGKLPMTSEPTLEAIADRNKRVEADKAWETCWLRRAMIASLTYVIAFSYMTYLGASPAGLHALVPTGGYLLSTLSLSLVKKWWVKRYV